ncbi:hypothetical protein DICVIV_04823 [Dictyocaulus viviparus]|uniref:Uncharacterized protein n=1 Tax=Dictyocaulus viviparus TaxID=29172 RepID=A0A0D8XZ52_DICVI|nr:hypothetical protein DICVIV_04823 [Dictyocaulus viviparus]
MREISPTKCTNSLKSIVDFATKSLRSQNDKRISSLTTSLFTKRFSSSRLLVDVQLQGLQPSTIYRVSVRTKHPKAVLEQRPVERCLDFKTLPKNC